MRFIRFVLIAGGIFNTVMGLIFFSNALLRGFFELAGSGEMAIFGRQASLPSVEQPMHLMLIHGFGAGALILGATLIYSARDPARYLPFIVFDGLGRLLYGSLMVIYVFHYSLPQIILPFAFLELFFAVSYLWMGRRLAES